MSEAPPPELPDEEVERAAGLIYRWTGMTFGPGKRYFLERRLIERMRRTASPDLRHYLSILPADEAERQVFINAFTINETYFYREDNQLVALGKQILPRVVEQRRPGDLVRIWCLPCSTGEEAYSVAIWLLENWRLVDVYNIEIVGSDIDTDALAQAVAGRYGERALARLPAPLVERYFEPAHGHRRQIIDDLRESVRFTPANLIDRATVMAQGRFDVILCRNLLIYFDEQSRQAAATNLHDALNPGGFLALGHSESMTRIDERFEMVRLDDAIVYRRP